jgi:hypothetical protein
MLSTEPYIEPLLPIFKTPQEKARRARQLNVERIDLDTALTLNKKWHSRLPVLPKSVIVGMGPRHVCYGATYDGGIYGVAVWSDAMAANRMRWPSSCILELRRLAIPNYAPKFTASRMLGKMAKLIDRMFPEVHRLISYQDSEVHTGTIYKAANWHVGYVQEKHVTHVAHHGTRQADQSSAPKIRWEYVLLECDCKEK